MLIGLNRRGDLHDEYGNKTPLARPVGVQLYKTEFDPRLPWQRERELEGDEDTLYPHRKSGSSGLAVTKKAAFAIPDFSVPTGCGTMKISTAFSVRNETARMIPPPVALKGHRGTSWLVVHMYGTLNPSLLLSSTPRGWGNFKY
jgi:hypothetical protein